MTIHDTIQEMKPSMGNMLNEKEECLSQYRELCRLRNQGIPKAHQILQGPYIYYSQNLHQKNGENNRITHDSEKTDTEKCTEELKNIDIT